MLRNQFAVIVLSLLIAACSSTEEREVSDEEKAEVYRELGVRYLQLGMQDVALQKLQQSLVLDDRNAKTHNAMAVTYERISKFDQAQKYYETSLTLAPEDPDTKNNYGRFLCKRGDYQRAMLFLQQAASSPLNHTRWKTLTNTGICDLLQGRNDKAEIYFKKALLLQQNYAPALIEMAKVNYAKGNFMSARAFLERFQGATGNIQTAESLLLGVRIEQALGDDERAQRYRKQLLRSFPGSEQTEQLL